MKYQPKGRPRGSSSDDGKANNNKTGLVFFLFFNFICNNFLIHIIKLFLVNQ